MSIASNNYSTQAFPTFSVAELNKQARQLLEGSFPMIVVEGEISNFASPRSGHWYFTLKDEQAQVRCALFKNRNAFLKYRPQDGDHVKLRARVSLYEGRGEFQLIGEYLEEAGSGALQAAFEALKAKLLSEGLFAAEHKQPIPQLPKHIGVITSPTGAAIRDILSVLKRRFPAIPVSIYPVAVQGADAPAQITQAVQRANRDQLCDLLIIARGGGSLEDLWAFNDEQLARAVFASRIPTISAVGHEVDFSICDFVADKRAPTPSAAAEEASPNQEDWFQNLDAYQRHFTRLLLNKTSNAQQRVTHLHKRLRHPGQRLHEQGLKLLDMQNRLQRSARQKLQQSQERLHNLETRQALRAPDKLIDQQALLISNLQQRAEKAVQSQLQQQQVRFAAQAHALQCVSPLSTLDRGYAIVCDEQQRVITDADRLQPGDRIVAQLAQGAVGCVVEDSVETPINKTLKQQRETLRKV